MKNKNMQLFLVGLLLGSMVTNPIQALTDTFGTEITQKQEAGNFSSESLNNFEKSGIQEQLSDNKDIVSESEAKENPLGDEMSSSLEEGAAINSR
jgi:hypothetical protein